MPAFSQTKPDTLKQRYDTLEPRKYSLRDFREGFRPSQKQWENTLEDFQFYNPLILNTFYNFSTGNIGGAAFSPTLVVDTITGFRNGFNVFDAWNISGQSVPLLSSNVPFTRVKYVFGSKKENLILADHAQRFGNYVSAGFSLKRISSEGFYTNGKNTSTDFNIYAMVSSRNFRYRALASFLAGNNKNQENGGLKYSPEFSITLQPANLAEAKTVWKRTSAIYTHSYSIGKAIDSIPLDSVRKKPIYSVRFGHEFEFSQQKYAFSNPNPDTAFFPVQIQDTLIRDSSRLRGYYNTVFFTNENSRGFLKKWIVGAKNSILQWQNEALKNNYVNTSVWADVRLGFGKRLFMDAYAQLELTGYNKSDLSIRPALSFLFGNDSVQTGYIRAGVFAVNQTPAFIFSQWQSSHFAWANSGLSKTQFYGIDAKLSLPKYRFTLNFIYKNVLNYTYFDTNFQPTQESSLINIMELRLNKVFRLGKWGYYVNGQGQVVSNPAVFPMPKLMGRSGLFFESWVFKKAMLMRVGTDFSYADKFKGYAYQPELNQFYLNTSSLNMGNQYRLDIYISARVKRTSFFFKYERLNGIWDKTPIYAVDNYPFPGGAIKFGVNWIFMDYLPKPDAKKE